MDTLGLPTLVLSGVAAGAYALYALRGKSDAPSIPQIPMLQFFKSMRSSNEFSQFTTSALPNGVGLVKVPFVGKAYLLRHSPEAARVFHSSSEATMSFLEGTRTFTRHFVPASNLRLSNLETIGLLAKTLSPDNLIRYMPDMAAVVRRHLDRLPESGTIDTFPYIYDVVVELVITIFLGFQSPDVVAQIADAIRVSDLEQYLRNPIYALFPSLTKTRRTAAHESLKAVLAKIIEERRAKGIVRDDLLDRAVEKYQGDLDLVLSTLWIGIFAATVNQFASTAWMLYHASSSPDVKAKLDEEIAALGDDYTRFLEKAPYLEATLRETIRVHLFGMSARRTMEDVQVGNVTIPANSLVLFLTATLHMNEEYYPQPTEFRPERLLDESGECPHEALAKEFKLLAFGAGKHPCTGMRLASTIIKIVFSILHTSLDYSFPEPPVMPRFAPFGVQRPAKPLLMNYKKVHTHA
eukprot:m.255018 g.255018  ORF g.255018 m.255018 type:complete len:465 (-) comp19260_c0_seq1:73-1467(-)